MACYRIYRLKENLRAQFRQLPHVSGVSRVKLKDYDEAGAVEAPTPYAAWFALKESGGGDALQVGDVLVDDANDVRIVKYVGFEPAEWIVPDVKLPQEIVFTTAAGTLA